MTADEVRQVIGELGWASEAITGLNRFRGRFPDPGRPNWDDLDRARAWLDHHRALTEQELERYGEDAWSQDTPLSRQLADGLLVRRAFARAAQRMTEAVAQDLDSRRR
jgi:hypothetical protein